MRRWLAVTVLLTIVFNTSAQSTAGVTGIADTSFSVTKEYDKLVKTHPFITPILPSSTTAVVEKKDVVYCTAGNRKLKLDVFSPSAPSSKKRPAVVIIHGGGWRSGNKAQHHPLAQRLAALGYVCFTPEYRLSTEALYPAAIHDLKAALRWMHSSAKTYGIDTTKLAVAGFSAGGQLAALLATTIGDKAFEGTGCHQQQSSAVQALIDLDGTLSFVHPESGEGDDSKRISAATYWFGYAKNENPELWQQASPLSHVGPKTPPTLFINSSVARMHAGRDDFIRVLDANGIYNLVKTVEGSPHSFPLFQPWFDSTVTLMHGFLQKVFAQKKAPLSVAAPARHPSNSSSPAQQPYVSKVWVADNGDSTYKNPILHADYSDPDAIRVGDDYYMTSSSFEDVPGLPILHSKDLVNWRLIGHALKRLLPYDHFATTRHGEGVWAPSLRYRKGGFYLYYPDPDFGIYLTKAKKAEGPWSEPVLVVGGKGLIDPCPLWDDDGKLYLVHAYAGSRAGIKSIIAIKQLNADGTKAIDEGVIVYDGHETDPTIEGPKFYKRQGWYYIFAPAGGVPTGWQLVLRSKNVYGPYERKVVMDQGTTLINGPHQGAWVTTQTGEDWFLHFQDKEAYGRVVHLQPMTWKEGWPVIGIDLDGDGKGEPVLRYKKPNVGKMYPVQTPVESDEFNGTSLSLQWQWMANPKATWVFANAANGWLRLYSDKLPDPAFGGTKNLWFAPNVLLQKFPAEEFSATTKMSFTPNPKLEGEKAGLVVMGYSYAGLAVKNKKDGLSIVQTICRNAEKGAIESEQEITKLQGQTVFFRVAVTKGGQCRFSYSTDGRSFIKTGDTFTAEVGRWKGAKIGLFCTRLTQTNDAGYAEIDWFRVAKVGE